MIRIYTDGISYPNNLPPRQGHNSASSLKPNINLTFCYPVMRLDSVCLHGQVVIPWIHIYQKDFSYLLKKILEVDCLGGGESVLLAWWWYLHSLWSVEINNENEGPSLKCWKYIKGDESGGACLASRLLLLPAVWTQVQQFDQRLATTTVRCGLFV